MNGADYKAGKFAQSLRMQLFREHLGLIDSPEVDIRDAVSENFYRNVWIETARLNTEIYDEVCDQWINYLINLLRLEIEN